ncbi:very short patch repair endonuclease [Anaeromyxobacter sp. SG66]|uniref:very short patch repair endonuclease n=1 Tax=Anaeromyxobacter sp. SG66 TaxID=2925410 RepID=UPI001F59F38F|nr:very short patch repair endonuclease [Anaeromyxobacter sp. SG66]
MIARRYPSAGPLPGSADVTRRMSATRRRDTTPELALRSAVHLLGLRFAVDARPVETYRRRADLVFRGARVAVFMDGCFWHGCPKHCSWPKANAEWWRAKIERNKRRDHETAERLRDEGWVVVRFWEHEPVARCAARVAAVVKRRLIARPAPRSRSARE